jgi:hypothetical protein
MNELSGVRSGVTLILYQIILVLFALVAGIFGGIVAGNNVRMFGLVLISAGVTMIVAGIIGMIGKFMCLNAPAETEGKHLIISSVCCDMAVLLIALVQILKVVEPSKTMGNISNLINLVSQILFLIFLKKISLYINRSELADKSQSVLNLMGALFVCAIAFALLLFVLGPVAGLMGLVMMVLAILMFVRYVGLIVGMKAALERATGV